MMSIKSENYIYYFELLLSVQERLMADSAVNMHSKTNEILNQI